MIWEKQKKQNGGIIIYLLVTIFVFSMAMMPVINIVAQQIRAMRSTANKEEALQVAEAGISYYQWHLAHFPNDYKDGTSGSGPYLHNYTDFDTEKNIGQFSLVITPPATGSTIVTIQSTGWTTDYPSIQRIVTARYGIPSLAKYSFL